MQYLMGRNLLTESPPAGCYRLSVDGWDYLKLSPGGIPGRCFVAMSFDETLDDAYKHGIRPAIKEDCGFDPIRVDFVQHNGKICDKILAEIRIAQFLVADFTLHRAGFTLRRASPWGSVAR